MVQEICSDIRRLDSAKRNLTATKTALTRVSMFLTAVEQLDVMVQERQYREAANLLDAVNELNKHFDGYERTVPKIRELKSSVARTRDALTKQIFEDMEGIGDFTADLVLTSGDDENNQHYGYHSQVYQGIQTPELLRGAFLCADALGRDVRRTLRRTLCSSFLKPYDNIFRPGEPSSGLENTERRFSWIKRLLRSNNERFNNVFPHTWRFDEHIILDFAMRTANHLTEVLRGMGNDVDIASLMRALRKTLDFEIEMDSKFKLDQLDRDMQKKMGVIRSLRADSDPNEEAAAEGVDISAGIIATSKDAARLLDGDAPALVIKGAISSVFQNHLTLYVNAISDAIKDQVAKAVAEEKKMGSDDMQQILPSCTSLFLAIKNSIQDCLKFNNGQIFLDLIQRIKRILIDYARSLEIRLPVLNALGSEGQSKQGTALGQGIVPGIVVPGISVSSFAQSTKKLDSNGIKNICQILNSVEYCAETVSQMENMLKNRIDPTLQDKVDLEEEQDAFYAVITSCIQTLVRGLEGRIEPSLQTMVKYNWEAVDSPGDKSEYISRIGEEMADYVTEVRALLTAAYFRNFHDKFAESFIPHYRKCLLSIKKMGEGGAQQLLVDTSELKTIILAIPDAGKIKEDGTIAGIDTFRKYVTKTMTECELLLKLVGMSISNDTLLERFRIMWPDGAIDDLEEILELRAVKKATRVEITNAARKAGVQQRKGTSRDGDDGIDDSPVKSSGISAPYIRGVPGVQLPNKFMDLGLHAAGENIFASVGAGMGNALGKAVGGMGVGKKN